MNVKRIIFTTLSVLFLSLGVIGAILPGVPSIIFFVIGLWILANVDKKAVQYIRDHTLMKKFLATQSRFILPKPVTISLKASYLVFAWSGFIISLIGTTLPHLSLFLFVTAFLSTITMVVLSYVKIEKLLEETN